MLVPAFLKLTNTDLFAAWFVVQMIEGKRVPAGKPGNSMSAFVMPPGKCVCVCVCVYAYVSER